MARRKIAGILCVFQDLSTQPSAIWAAKLGAEAIGTASQSGGRSLCRYAAVDMSLACGDERLLGVGARFGEALQRLQLPHPEPAVPEAQGAHLGAVQLDAAILVGVKHTQIIKFAGLGVVGGVPHLEGHVGQPVKGDRVFLDDLDDGPLVVLEVGGVVPVGISRRCKAISVTPPPPLPWTCTGTSPTK